MKTAVEWLVEQIINNKFVKAHEQIEAIDQAKIIEKQQIIKTRQDVFTTGNLSNEEYYNETFNN